MKKINIDIESPDISLREGIAIVKGIEKSLPKNVSVQWWGWKIIENKDFF